MELAGAGIRPERQGLYIIQCTKSGYIHLFDGLTGTLLDEMNLGSNVEASPAVFDNHIVIGTRGGLIYGIKLK